VESGESIVAPGLSPGKRVHMKKYRSFILAIACIVLVIALVMTKRSDNAQQENDAASITDFSNQLDSARAQIASRDGTILTLSNNLDQSQSAAMAFSNQLAGAQSAIALTTEQIADLNQQVAAAKSENQALSQRVMDLTNQTAALTQRATALTAQIALVETNLNQANKDYGLLENRFRIDVAERVVIERKFNNLSALQAQIQKLKEDPFAAMISAESIYAGLDVEVKSNSFRVISPN
jgi:chromosome segregation ATPase